MSQARKDILNGWKEIAQYISRDIRTVERWEKQRGLPVRRIPGSGRGVVYAHISEVEQWLAGHKAEVAEAPEAREAAATVEPIALPEPRVEDGQPSPPHLATLPVAPLPAVTLPAVTQPAVTQPVVAQPVVAQPVVAPPVAGVPGRLAAAPAASGRLTSWMVAGACVLLALTGVGVEMRAREHGVSAQKGTEAGFSSSREHQHSSVPGVDELYLRGAFALERRTPESLEQARSALSAAIAKDAAFAPAYASLGETYCLLREYARMPDSEAWPQAEANAKKAASLDPQLSDAHAVLGFVDFFWRTDAPTADREFREALELDPKSVLAHHWYGSMLTHYGRLPEALQELDTAQHLNPSSFPILAQRALAIGLSGRRDEADAMLEDMLKENRVVGDHDSSTAHIVLAILSFQPPADLHRAISEYQRSAELRHDDVIVQRQAQLLKALETGGPRAMWQLQIQQAKQDHPGQPTYPMVEAEAQLGEREQAIRDLRQIMARPNSGAVLLNTDALLDPLRKDPAFAALSNVHSASPPANTSEQALAATP